MTVYCHNGDTMILLHYMVYLLMVAVSIWDLISPAHRRCGPEGCELPVNEPDNKSREGSQP